MLLLGGAPLLGMRGYLVHAQGQWFRWTLIHSMIVSWSTHIGLVNMLGWVRSEVMIYMIDVLEYI